MDYKRIWIYAVPLLGTIAVLFGVIWAVSTFSPSRSSGPVSLMLLCDESIRNPVEAPDIEHESGAIGRFQRRAGVRVNANYSTSEELLEMLILNREGDLLLVNDDSYIEVAREAGLIYETRPVARHVPVILVRQGNPHNIDTISDLSDHEIRLAITDPQASLLGRVTSDIFNKNGVSFHDLDNIQLIGNTVSEVAMAVNMDRADAAIVWHPMARQYSHRTDIVKISAENNVISQLVIAVLNTSENKELALRFADFISSPASQEIFDMYGFDISESITLSE